MDIAYIGAALVFFLISGWLIAYLETL